VGLDLLLVRGDRRLDQRRVDLVFLNPPRPCASERESPLFRPLVPETVYFSNPTNNLPDSIYAPPSREVKAYFRIVNSL
jgi:hypothetical protein